MISLPKPKRKKKSAKTKAWDNFSLFTRTRDAIKTTNTLTECRCVTCGRLYLVKELQAGHFIDGRHNSILFDERNCHAQCFSCNIKKHGNTIPYWSFMERTYGREVIDELIYLDRIPKQMKECDYEELAILYKNKLNDIINL